MARITTGRSFLFIWTLTISWMVQMWSSVSCYDFLLGYKDFICHVIYTGEVLDEDSMQVLRQLEHMGQVDGRLKVEAITVTKCGVM